MKRSLVALMLLLWSCEVAPVVGQDSPIIEATVVRTNGTIEKGRVLGPLKIQLADGDNLCVVELHRLASLHLGNADEPDRIVTKAGGKLKGSIDIGLKFALGNADATQITSVLNARTEVRSMHFSQVEIAPPAMAKDVGIMPAADKALPKGATLKIEVNFNLGAKKPDGKSKGKEVKFYHPHGQTYRYFNNFGQRTYVSEQRYTRVLPGMQLNLAENGSWELIYSVVSVGGASKIAWELQLQGLNKQPIHLNSLPERIGQIGDREVAESRVVYKGVHPALPAFVRSFPEAAHTGRHELVFQRQAYVTFLESRLIERPVRPSDDDD